ncbi:MAG: radical SAM protein [Bacilli bacterium]
MTIELKPLGNSCNLDCTYCYQIPMREAGNTRTTNKYNLSMMLHEARNKMERQGYVEQMVVFGGESLLVPKRDLEEIFQESYELKGESAIQTNGSLIDREHIEMFMKYNVSVGFSIDGPNELNALRKPKSKHQKAIDTTNQSIENLIKCVNNGVQVGIIITIHKENGVPGRIERLLNWIRWLGDNGVTSGNVHFMEVDTQEAEGYALSKEECSFAFHKLAEFMKNNPDLHYNPFNELYYALKGEEYNQGCIWSNCDPLNTQSVYGIEGDGSISNCGMVNKDGIEWTKSEGTDYVRDRVLYQTPQELKGCKDCRFFMFCNGHCVGAAENGDWRNRTIHCESIKEMFMLYEEAIEKEGKTPLSKHPKRKEIEERYMNNLACNRRIPVSKIINEMENQHE